ncbi:hypothetical protein Tsubulata_007926 [Turnera subulata]|uniref:Tify domain-containing protein n=1 Tax=Turnera subulata TaxID=218843 RepID=A0A9Q0FPS6_9ROSI|nr:hypothetical protein Tsubulata_007926 [Turnera subulata]
MVKEVPQLINGSGLISIPHVNDPDKSTRDFRSGRERPVFSALANGDLCKDCIGRGGKAKPNLWETLKKQNECVPCCVNELLIGCCWRWNKGFWMAKDADGDPAFDNPSRFDSKRSHQWFMDATEPELFPNKKQAVQAPNSTSSSGFSDVSAPSWDNTSGFQAVPNQFIDRLFGSESTRSVNFAERNMFPAGTANSNAPVSLSTPHTQEDPEVSLNYGGFRKVKVNQVKESDFGMHAPKAQGFSTENSSTVSTGQAFNSESENSFISIGQAYDKEDGGLSLMGHTYHREDDHIGSTNPAYMKGDENAIQISDSYDKEDANMISFGGFHDAHDIVPIGRPISTYDPSYNQSSVQTPDAVCERELEASNAVQVVNNSQATKTKPASKNKPESKTTKKEAPNSFPSNVRSLISTGMLDGVPVKYVALSREELRGIIKGSGYLCGCQSCNFSKVLNAYEFERHAGCKTKHPNNHIYFDNGKTIYQIVQELRSTPESMLFDVIQTVFGAPINQKSFRIWKESFQAATRELQRIYGKEELNL